MNEKYQLAIIGTGSGGSEAALLAARKGLKVIAVENGAIGGTRLHHGAYAVRALHATARLHGEFFKDPRFQSTPDLSPDSRMQSVKAQRVARTRLACELQKDLEKVHVRVVFGRGTLLNEHRISIRSRNNECEEIEADHVILATGTRPAYVGYQNSRIVNSEELLERESLPEHLFIVGGGFVGCEFAAIYRKFGCRVTLAEKGDRLLPGWDKNAGMHVLQQLRRDGVEVLLGWNIPVDDVPRKKGWPILIKPDGLEVSPDLLLVATGRKANTKFLGLEELGILANPFIEVDGQLRTDRKNILAIGDVNGLDRLDSAAVLQARLAVDVITGIGRPYSSRWIPRCLDTDPPVASIGWMEEEAAEAGLEIEVKSDVTELDPVDSNTMGQLSRTLVKIIAERATKQIRGCLAIGKQASEIINFAALVIQSGVSTRQIEKSLLVHSSAPVSFQRCAAKFN